MNTRQIKACFQKRHIAKLVNEVLAETSEFSKNEGNLRYSLKVADAQDIVDGIRIADIEEVPEKSAIRVMTQVVRCGKWCPAYKFTIYENKILTPWGFAKLEVATVDKVIKYCIHMDHFMDDATAIPIYF